MKTHRIESLDLLRGVVMVIMALDHARLYFHYGTFYSAPTDLDTTTPALFFTRWITHFCAPVFVFLAGTSAYLYGQRRTSKKDVSLFLLTRGVWLIFLEMTVVTFGWTFDVSMSLFIIQVIWAIGLSMIMLSWLIWLPRPVLLMLGILLVAGHNVLDGTTTTGTDIPSIAWYLMHQDSFQVMGGRGFYFHYPALPWIGVMVLGYLFGQLYQQGFDNQKRQRLLLQFGAGAVVLFVLLRAVNVYGDLHPWTEQKNAVYTFLSFLNVTKYPPSLLYVLMTLGPAMLFLAFSERIKTRFSDMLVVIGRVPLFFYVTHIYLFHFLGMIAVVLSGRPAGDMVLSLTAFGNETLSNFGFNLAVVYAVWIVVMVLLYPFCKKYNSFKMANPSKWWLSYL